MESGLKTVLTKLGITMTDEMTDEQAIAAVVSHKAPAPASPATLSPAVLQALDLGETATDDQITGKILALKNPVNVVPAEEVQRLQGELAQRDILAAIQTAITDKKMYPKEKEEWLKELQDKKITLGAFQAFMASRPPIVQLEDLPKGETPKAPDRTAKPLNTAAIYADRRKQRAQA